MKELKELNCIGSASTVDVKRFCRKNTLHFCLQISVLTSGILVLIVLLCIPMIFFQQARTTLAELQSHDGVSTTTARTIRDS